MLGHVISVSCSSWLRRGLPPKGGSLPHSNPASSGSYRCSVLMEGSRTRIDRGRSLSRGRTPGRSFVRCHPASRARGSRDDDVVAARPPPSDQSVCEQTGGRFHSMDRTIGLPGKHGGEDSPHMLRLSTGVSRRGTSRQRGIPQTLTTNESAIRRSTAATEHGHQQKQAVIENSTLSATAAALGIFLLETVTNTQRRAQRTGGAGAALHRQHLIGNHVLRARRRTSVCDHRLRDARTRFSRARLSHLRVIPCPAGL